MAIRPPLVVCRSFYHKWIGLRISRAKRRRENHDDATVNWTKARPTRGTGSVAGVSITDRDGLRTHIGYLPEEPPLYDQATAYEQLEYAAGLRDLPAEATRDRIDVLLDKPDLTADADTRIADYSKGMRQKTAYIQAVLHEPDVVFFDEPTSGLDPRAARTLRG